MGICAPGCAWLHDRQPLSCPDLANVKRYDGTLPASFQGIARRWTTDGGTAVLSCLGNNLVNMSCVLRARAFYALSALENAVMDAIVMRVQCRM